MMRQWAMILLAAAWLAGCATSSQRGTVGELERVRADLDEVTLDDSLELAAQSYRRYLEETAESALTPEAMRRLADLQIEQEYGVLGGRSGPVEMAAPEPGVAAKAIDSVSASATAADAGESLEEFEKRATQRQELLSGARPTQLSLDAGLGESVPSGPREAIAMYRRILSTYPNYERNDQVLYQMSRAYDEIGEPDEAMTVMDRLVAEYPHSKYLDEIYFRRGEYYFVRKRYRDAEDAYAAIVRMGESSSYYELALYKKGWALYKQQFYEEALNEYMAMLDHRQSIGYDFDEISEESEEHRVADTFRVVSLSFSNLGGPEVVDEYFVARGERPYADKIYSNLGEFYFSKLRYDDAASVYRSFVESKPFHKVAPHFSMRVVEIFTEAGFPKLVVESKKEFASRYAMHADYWQHFDVDDSPEVVGFLKTNLTDLANHYHALYQEEELLDERPANFAEAERWYREFLASFPAVEESPTINYQLADLLLEDERFGEAAGEYERTAYNYLNGGQESAVGDDATSAHASHDNEKHERASAAGYAAIYAHRQNLERATGAQRLVVKQATVESSLRFADTFPAHDEVPVVLGAAADDLYEMEDFDRAIDTAQALIERYPDAETALRRSAWAVIAHSSIDLARYAEAEFAYMNVLELTSEDDENRAAVIDGLAAAIYKQGEQANLMQDFAAAADHFLRIRDLAPDSEIRSVAEYDAAAALMKLENWAGAAGVLEQFRDDHPQHELQADATKQLAHIYREDGQTARAAAEHERIANETDDEELSRAALLTAAELYDEAAVAADAIRVYQRYVNLYPEPLDIAMESRARLAELWKAELDYQQYYVQLGAIVAADRAAGEARTDRSRYLAARAALELAERSFRQFAELELRQPFEQSLAEKQRRMDETMTALGALVDYQVAEVTAAATFYIAETYYGFSAALIGSERPPGLSEAEKIDYEMVIEEEAYPFEELAIEVHEENFELLAAGVFNPWVQQSLDKLAVLMPGRYAKNEISDGYVGSIDSYAYRMPIAPDIDTTAPEEVDTPAPEEPVRAPEATAQLAPGGPG